MLGLAAPTSQHPYILTFHLLLNAAVDAAHAVDVAHQSHGHVLLQFLADSAGEGHEAAHRLDADVRAVEAAMARKLALGETLNLLVVDGLDDANEVGHTRIAEVTCDL